MSRMTRVLVIDNYDSFVYTLNGYLRQLGAETEVVRNDVPSTDGLAERSASTTACSSLPVPASRRDAGVSMPVVHAAVEAGVPLLGVCLGHQAIAEAFGGVVDERRGADARQDEQVDARRERASSPASRSRSPPPATTRSPWWTARSRTS